MATTVESENVVRYQFQADDDEWKEWKNTVERSKSLETRINELLRADTNGDVYDDGSVDKACEHMRRAVENDDISAVEDAMAILGCDIDD